MKTLVSEKTIKEAFENDVNLKKFIHLYSKYFEYMLTLARINPEYELTYEEFVKNVYGKVTLL